MIKGKESDKASKFAYENDANFYIYTKYKDIFIKTYGE